MRTESPVIQFYTLNSVGYKPYLAIMRTESPVIQFYTPLTRLDTNHTSL